MGARRHEMGESRNGPAAASVKAPATGIHIWVRATLDWSDGDAAQEAVVAAFRTKLAVWDATFTLPYHRFRHAVCEIARANLACVEGAVVSHWDEIPDGALVLPVDDDDWFAPDVALELARLREQDWIGCRWPARFLEVPIGPGHRAYLARRRLLPWTPEKHLCSTNSYAFVKEPGAELVGRRHVRASRVFAEQRERVGVVERPLSLMNRTLASQTTLLFRRPRISRARLLRKADAYRRLYPSADLRGVEWAAEYVERMAGLTDELGVRAMR